MKIEHQTWKTSNSSILRVKHD